MGRLRSDLGPIKKEEHKQNFRVENVQLWLMHVDVNIAAVVWNLLTAASSLFQTFLQSRNWPRWWVMIIYMIIMVIIEERRSAMSTFFYLLNLIITVYFKLFMQQSIIPLVWQGGRSPEPWSLSTPQPFFIVVKIIFIYNYNLIINMIQNIISMN